MPPKRMTANPVKPTRHRAGKLAESSSESSSDDDSDAETTTKPKKRALTAAPSKPRGAGQIVSRGPKGKLNLQPTREDAAADRAAIEAMAKEAGFETESEDDVEDNGRPGAAVETSEDEESDEDDEEDDSSSEEAPRRLMILPKFIPKSQRLAGNKTNNGLVTSSKPKPITSSTTADADATAAKAEAEARQKATDAMVEEQIRLRAADKRGDSSDSGSDVDTTDEVDPEAEHAAWKLRELLRLKRDRDILLSRERELEAIEARRNMSTEDREREDAAKIARQKEEKEARGKMGFMQKYHHKGVFYQEEARESGLLDRDLMGAKFADEGRRDAMPVALQMRDMTKLGRKGASKYKDLRSEDTGSWGARYQSDRWGGVGRDGDGGGDDRFRPDGDARTAKGANMIPLGEKEWGDRYGDRGEGRGGDREGRDGRWDDKGGERHHRDGVRDTRESDRDSYGDRDRDRGSERRRDRSRSRSPRRDRRRDDRDDYYRSRKREGSRDRDRDRQDDKRRRVDSRY